MIALKYSKNYYYFIVLLNYFLNEGRMFLSRGVGVNFVTNNIMLLIIQFAILIIGPSYFRILVPSLIKSAVGQL